MAVLDGACSLWSVFDGVQLGTTDLPDTLML